MRQIIVTVGANEAILLAMLATLNPGDEVLVPDPMWLHYFYCAQLAGARVVSVPLRAEDGWQLDPAEVERRITPRTRMVVLNSPHNPTGAVYPRATFEAIAEIVERHDLLLLSDEIYQKLRYDGVEHVSPAAMPQIADRTITVDGFSKTYAMTGWRLGYVVAPPQLIDSMIRVHQYTTVCATSFAQAGAVAALRGPQESVQAMVAEFDHRREWSSRRSPTGQERWSRRKGHSMPSLKCRTVVLMTSGLRTCYKTMESPSSLAVLSVRQALDLCGFRMPVDERTLSEVLARCVNSEPCRA